MPTEIKAQNTTTLASVKAIYDAADQANTLLDGMQTAAIAAGTTLDGIYQDAADAQTAADDAQASADNASEYAARALGNLSTVQNITETLNWITAHGTMTLTSDVALDPTHVYFVVDPAGDYVVGGTHYSVVTEPDVDDINTYYELSINESLNNYVATHLAVDSEGLWIIPDAGGNKVLIATGSGSTYTTAGTYIVGKVGGVDTVLAEFGASGAQIGLSSAGNVVVDNDSVDIRDNSTVYATFGANGVTVGRDERGYSHISVENNGMKMLYNTDFYPYETLKPFDVSYGTTETGGYEDDYPYYEIGIRKAADNTNYSSSSTYNVGDTCRYNDKEYICNHKISTPEAWNRSHWNYITGAYSVVEGSNCISSNIDSHAEGNTTKAIGLASHSEGFFSMAVGDNSHAENEGEAYGDYSHAENYASANGDYSHAEGSGIANGNYSHAQNIGTKASSIAQTALGSWNIEDTADTYAVIVGNGSSGTPSNALTVDWSGNVKAAGGGVFGDDVSVTGDVTTTGDVTDGSGTSIAHLLEVQNTYGSAMNMASALSLSTSSKKIPLKDFNGNGCSLSSNGIKVDKSGVYRVDGSAVFATGFTANDIIHLYIAVNNTTAQMEIVKRAITASPYEVVLIGACILNLNANDVVYLYAYNQTASRGSMTNNNNTRLTINRIA